jgi:nucleoside-diphosphate-sugar epimerase
MLDEMDSNLEINFVEKDFPEISHQYLNSSKMKKVTGWKAKTSLKNGLKKSINFYKEIL